MTKEPDLPPWSWIVSVLGLLLVAGAIGYTLYKVATKEETPPDIVIQQERVVQGTESYLVEIRIFNKGGSAASGLVVEGSLVEEGNSLETSTITIEYAPAESSRKAGLVFTRDPRRYQLKIRALGYEEP